MTGSKKWYLSRTLWGAVVVLLGTILGWAGYTVTEVEASTFLEALLASIEAVSGLVGVILVIYGRLKATKVVK